MLLKTRLENSRTRFSDIDFQIDYEDGSISFSRTLPPNEEGDPEDLTVDHIKSQEARKQSLFGVFSLGYSAISIRWGYVFWWKYIYIDDPIHFWMTTMLLQ